MPQDHKNTTPPAAHHFLFHIFRLDKELHPMPGQQAERLLQYLKQVFSDPASKTKGRE